MNRSKLQAAFIHRVQTDSAREVRHDPLACNRMLPAVRRQAEGGYLLLAVLLLMALMIIAATVEAPRLVQQIKRDREEEMIHRGTEYARAVKKFYKKFGRYPANLEQLDNTNQIRFLRRRFKDPLTKDGKWKLLNYGDIQTLINPNTPGTPAGALGAQGQGAFGQPSAITSFSSTGSLSSQSSTPSPVNILYNSSTGFDQGTPPAPQQQQQQIGVVGNAPGGVAGNSPQGNAQQGNNPFANTFSLGSSNASNTGQQGSAAGNQPGGTGSSSFSSAGGNQTFGGGAIVGVASVSKDPTIRVYNKKKTYDEWQFIYNPMMDRVNVLLRGPYQPTTFGGAQIGTPAGQLNQSGQGAFGQQPSGFGQPSGGSGAQYSPQQNSPVNQFPPDQNQPH
jgi:type II secretory pathway pseudopilin PulG